MTFQSINILRIKSGKISYRDLGNGETLFLLHGLAGSSESWKYQFSKFSPSYRVVAWDAPGYGGSDALPPNINSFSSALKDLFDNLKLPKVTLLGHSMGGIIAANFAAKNPNRIKCLLLSCTHTGHGISKGLDLKKNYKTRIKSLMTGSRRKYGEECAKRILAANANASTIKFVEAIASQTRLEGLEAAARIIQETDNSKQLKSLNIPVTIISGEKDPVVSTKKTSTLLKLVPQARHVVIPKVGHAPYIEDTNSFNEVINSVLRN